jgi:hypothetical protein
MKRQDKHRVPLDRVLSLRAAGLSFPEISIALGPIGGALFHANTLMRAVSLYRRAQRENENHGLS